MESTWENRDLPVLDAIVRMYDDTGQVVRVDAIQDATGLSSDDVQRALRALDAEIPPLVTKMKGSFQGGYLFAGAPTGHARRTVGAWPTPNRLADRIVTALNEAAEQESDPETKSRLKRGAEALGGVGKGVLTGVLTHVITQRPSRCSINPANCCHAPGCGSTDVPSHRAS